MTKHPDHIVGWNGTIKELAEAIGNMRYDIVSDLLDDLSENLLQQGVDYHRRGRKKLRKRLFSASKHLDKAMMAMAKADICEPHMEE